MKSATAVPTERPARETVNLRVTAAERDLIDQAVKSSGKTTLDSVLSAAIRAPEEDLLDRTTFVVSPEKHSKFLAILVVPRKLNGG